MPYRPILFAVLLLLLGVQVALVVHAPSSLGAWTLLGLLLFLLGRAVVDVMQTRHAVLRNWPLVGHFRYLFEAIRPEIQQYFVESDTDERPFSREFRAVAYQRAKGVLDTKPFGTERDVEREGYEWMTHSMDPRPLPEAPPRVRIGGPACTSPYDASYLNVSAMSYGSLGPTAVQALNRGAREGGFYHNTGEGGISPYHLEGGDLVWQIGTGYFGCRTRDGDFDPGAFREAAARPEVKMVELKLSQGAKPGHGGILPGRKVSEEIADIRGVEPWQTVVSPAAHRTFSTPLGLCEFVGRLRELADGKPVGIKLCVGSREELLAVAKAMLATEITPDYIAVDGGEGGTGAAPLEFSNSVGMPYRDGLLLAHNVLVGTGLRDRIRIVASGKILTGFHIVRALALGADLCASARSMMFALGCIQAIRCNTNRCPVGVTTQDPRLVRGLVVADKAPRVARYHAETVESLLELVSAAGLDDPSEIRPEHLWRRVSVRESCHFGEFHTYLEPGALLEEPIPREFLADWLAATPERFGGVFAERGA